MLFFKQDAKKSTLRKVRLWKTEICDLENWFSLVVVFPVGSALLRFLFHLESIRNVTPLLPFIYYSLSLLRCRESESERNRKTRKEKEQILENVIDNETAVLSVRVFTGE